MKKRQGMFRRLGALWVLPVLLAALLLLGTALNRLRLGRDAEGQRKLEESIRRSAVTCYAVEGIYPPTLSYLEEHYGVQIDRSRYAVFYEAFAENLMPEITVVELE